MTARDESKVHKRIITIRHTTPSRRKIVLIVAQTQTPLGEWMAPTITFEGPMVPILESARYARDVGIGLIVAAYFYDEMMMRVKNNDAQNNELTDLSITDEG